LKSAAGGVDSFINAPMKKISFGKNFWWTIHAVLLVGFLALALPKFFRARNTSSKNTCVNNLRQIDAAKQQWALENRQVDAALATSDDVRVYLKNNTFPKCPESGKYIIGQVSKDPTCSLGIPDSLFFGPDSYFFGNGNHLRHKLPPP
jgi:hypothetical protein